MGGGVCGCKVRPQPGIPQATWYDAHSGHGLMLYTRGPCVPGPACFGEQRTSDSRPLLGNDTWERPPNNLPPPPPPRSRFGTCARTPLSQVPPSWDPDEVVSGEPLGPRQEEQT